MYDVIKKYIRIYEISFPKFPKTFAKGFVMRFSSGESVGNLGILGNFGVVFR